jgi:hypothetical protein
VRVLRASVASGVSTGFALAFHVAGGAPVPGLLGIAIPFALAALVSSLLMTRRPRLSATIAATSLAQLAFHTLFVLGTPSVGSSAAATAHVGHAAHAGHAAMTMASGAAVPDVALALHGDARMWLMHGAAAVVTALMLQRGEMLLALLLRLAGAVVAVVAPHLPSAAPVRPRRTPSARPLETPHPLHDRVVATARRRGPPHLQAA